MFPMAGEFGGKVLILLFCSARGCSPAGIATPLLFDAAGDGRLPHIIEDGIFRFSRATAIPLIERASVSEHCPDAA
ncbi:UNVERIFIED_ORG: hypothetical protein ABIB13_003220 [Arthrobacter sp. UYEF2]